MSCTRLLILTCLILSSQSCEAQADSILHTLENLQKFPVKYFTAVDHKIDKYSNRITDKTEKTLAKLSRWENKIKAILDKVSPETSTKLFGNGQHTFSSVLDKIREGKTVVEGYKAKYNDYRDKLTNSIKYLEAQQDKVNKSLIEPIAKAKMQLKELEQDIANTEAVEIFIKERKVQLLNEAIKYIGKSKYLAKINKETYYYIETLRNYKEIFSNKDKAEQTALQILNKIPAFQKFLRQNSQLASLFRVPGNDINPQNISGLQTRTDVESFIRNQIASGGPNALAEIKQNMNQARLELNDWKNKVLKSGGTGSEQEIPNFKPNKEKSKTFLQRIEIGSNFQFNKTNSLLPATADIALSVGYKLNNRSIVGIGLSYKAGLGSIERIRITHQGAGFRSYIDWNLKKQFFVTGGFELNYNAGFTKIHELKNFSVWQQSGLIGISKKIPIKTKWTKGTKLQVLFDMFHRQHVPVSQPVLFRIGYEFK